MDINRLRELAGQSAVREDDTAIANVRPSNVTGRVLMTIYELEQNGIKAEPHVELGWYDKDALANAKVGTSSPTSHGSILNKPASILKAAGYAEISYGPALYIKLTPAGKQAAQKMIQSTKGQ